MTEETTKIVVIPAYNDIELEKLVRDDPAQLNSLDEIAFYAGRSYSALRLLPPMKYVSIDEAGMYGSREFHMGCLKHLASVERLEIMSSMVEEIYGLEHLTMLRSLDLSGNEIDRIENVGHLDQLERLSLDFNNIDRVENLEGLVSLKFLNLFKNSVDDISYLPGYLAKKCPWAARNGLIIDLSMNPINWNNPMNVQALAELRQMGLTVHVDEPEEVPEYDDSLDRVLKVAPEEIDFDGDRNLVYLMQCLKQAGDSVSGSVVSRLEEIAGSQERLAEPFGVELRFNNVRAFERNQFLDLEQGVEHIGSVEYMLSRNSGSSVTVGYFRSREDPEDVFCWLSFNHLNNAKHRWDPKVFDKAALARALRLVRPGSLAFPLRGVSFRDGDLTDFRDAEVDCDDISDYEAFYGVEYMQVRQESDFFEIGLDVFSSLRELDVSDNCLEALFDVNYLPVTLERIDFSGNPVTWDAVDIAARYACLKTRGVSVDWGRPPDVVLVPDYPEETYRFKGETDTPDELIRAMHLLKASAIEASSVGGESEAFRKYTVLMAALGLGVEGARGFNDYDHLTEQANSIDSLNMTALIWNNATNEDIFVKFYDSRERCEKDLRIQNALAESGLVNPAEFLDLTDKGIDDLLECMHESHLEHTRKSECSLSTHLSRKVTVARDRKGAKLGYGIFTRLVLGDTLSNKVKDSRHQEKLEPLLQTLVGRVLELHDYANRNLGEDVAMRDYYTPVVHDSEPSADYGRAVGNLHKRLGYFAKKKKYVSFVHGDLHGNNVLYDSVKGGVCFFDFERSGFSLKVEDLVRLYQIAEDFGGHDMAERLKDYFFTHAFGRTPLFSRMMSRITGRPNRAEPVYDKDECDEMFSLVKANYYLENTAYYRNKASESQSAEEKASWQKKYDNACAVIRQCTEPYLDRRDVDAILKYLEAARDTDD